MWISMLLEIIFRLCTPPLILDNFLNFSLVCIIHSVPPVIKCNFTYFITVCYNFLCTAIDNFYFNFLRLRPLSCTTWPCNLLIEIDAARAAGVKCDFSHYLYPNQK